MTRLFNQPVADATGPAAQLFGAIKSAVGMVPNGYAGIGNNSPVALEAALHVDGALRKGSLNARELEVIRLAVSQHAGCDYCLAAHTVFGRKVGLSAEAIASARHGDADTAGAGTGTDARHAALATFVRALIGSSGAVPQVVFDAVKTAGYTDAQVVDTLLAISSITFTNLFNRVNDTVLDFPPAV